MLTILRPLSLLTLTEAHIETIGRLLFATIGSLFSPSWVLMEWSLGPYVNISALTNPETFLAEYFNFIITLHDNGSAIAYKIITPILATLVISIGFIYLSSRIGLYASRLFIRHYYRPAL